MTNPKEAKRPRLEQPEPTAGPSKSQKKKTSKKQRTEKAKAIQDEALAQRVREWERKAQEELSLPYLRRCAEVTPDGRRFSADGKGKGAEISIKTGPGGGRTTNRLVPAINYTGREPWCVRVPPEMIYAVWLVCSLFIPVIDLSRRRSPVSVVQVIIST